MFDLNVAVVTFHNGFSPNDIGGASSGPVYLRDQLSRHIKNVDFITLRNNKNYQSPIAADAKFVTDFEVLENYDFVIFTGPGLTYEKFDESTKGKYSSILDHAKRFTFICNEENDRKLYPYYEEFLYHPNIKFVTFNCPTMATKTFPDYVEAVGDWDHVILCPVMPDKEVVLERARRKQNKIMSTCRWTTSKRVLEYLTMAPEFIKNGIEVFAAGSHQSYWYNLEIGELPKDTYTDLGFFEPSQIPDLLSDVKYHWNFLFQKRGMGQKSHQPRLEIATMEAIREGCLPVICEEFTPEWVGYDSALRISKDDYLKIPEILGAMTDEERLNRISLLYDLLDIALVQNYEFSHHIARKCGYFDDKKLL